MSSLILLSLKINLYIPLICLPLLIFLIGCQSNADKREFIPGSPEYKGQDIFVRMACNACHSIDGSLKLGPTIKNQYGKDILHTDGTMMIIDDDYIRQSLLDPLKHIAESKTHQLNGASCHSCCFVAETTCAFFNQFLDRWVINNENAGFFKDVSDE